MFFTRRLLSKGISDCEFKKCQFIEPNYIAKKKSPSKLPIKASHIIATSVYRTFTVKRIYTFQPHEMMLIKSQDFRIRVIIGHGCLGLN